MTIEELQKKNKQLLELVGKYDKFANELKNEYFSEINRENSFVNRWQDRVIKETCGELDALRNELEMIKNDK